MITVPQLDPVTTIADDDVIMITHSNGTTEKIESIALTGRKNFSAVPGADMTEAIKNTLNLLSELPQGSYNGLINPQNGYNSNYNIFVLSQPNYNFEVGIIEELNNGGVYYVSREQINQGTPNYSVKRIDMPDISTMQVATIVPSRFAPDYTAWCRWWRCGRMVTVNIYTSDVYSKIGVGDAIFTGLPKPIPNSSPSAVLSWAGNNGVCDACYIVNNNGDVLVAGGPALTDTLIYGTATFTYITID